MYKQAVRNERLEFRREVRIRDKNLGVIYDVIHSFIHIQIFSAHEVLTGSLE